MNYGPMQFAAYLARKGGPAESATVEAARAAAPARCADANQLTVISGNLLTRVSRGARVEAVSVYEAVAAHTHGMPGAGGPVKVHVGLTPYPVVLVLSAHQTVQWEISVAAGAVLNAVLLAGYGKSTVAGAGDALVTTIGGFYAFRRGSSEYRHLESEVLRCTGRRIAAFRSVYAGHAFEIA